MRYALLALLLASCAAPTYDDVRLSGRFRRPRGQLWNAFLRPRGAFRPSDRLRVGGPVRDGGSKLGGCEYTR